MRTPTLLAVLMLLTPPTIAGQEVQWDEIRLAVGEQIIAPVDAAVTDAADAEEAAPGPSWLEQGDQRVDQLILGAHRMTLLKRGATKQPVAFGGDRGKWFLLGGPNSADKHAWSHELLEHEPLESDGAFLMSATRPYAAHGAGRPLTAFGKKARVRVLVLPGERSDLLLVNPFTGKIDRRLNAPWEFERAFIGPSVWSATIDRFGTGDFGFGGDEDKDLSVPRAAFEKRCTGWILGGPVVIRESIFLAIAHAPAGQWARQRASCRLLELNLTLQTKGLLDLSAPVDPHGVQVVPGGIVWSTSEGGLMRVDPLGEHVRFSSGPGSHSGRCDLRWLVRFDPQDEQDVYLLTDAAGRFSAGHEDVVLTSTHGGRVLSGAKSTMRFPIDVTTVTTGMSRRIEILVPFDAALPVPTSNYSKSGSIHKTLGARHAGITGIEVVGETLVVTVGQDSVSRALAFPLSAMEEVEARDLPRRVR